MKIFREYTLEEMKRKAEHNRLLRYGMKTMWWGMDEVPWYSTNAIAPDKGLPCDPRGGVLMQTNECLQFIEAAEANPAHYGKHGLRTFLLSYHGCVITDDGLPSCFTTWQEYNDLIDRHDAQKSLEQPLQQQ